MNDDLLTKMLDALKSAKPVWQQHPNGLRGDQPSDNTPVNLSGKGVSGDAPSGRYVVVPGERNIQNQA